MVDKKLNVKIENLGFVVSSADRGKLKVFREEIPSHELIMKLFELLSLNECMCFWNYYHITISDPGSYVTAHIVKDRAVYMEGNHGWSADYKRVSLEKMAELVRKNWDKICDYNDQFLNCIYIEPDLYAKKDRNIMSLIKD